MELDLEKLKKSHPADIAEALRSLENHQRLAVFKSLPDETAAQVLSELDKTSEGAFLERLSTSKISQVLESMQIDDAVDILGILSHEKQSRVLEHMEKAESSKVQELLKYKKDTAGGIMTTEFLALDENLIAGQAIEVLREYARTKAQILYTYVVDKRKHLLGVLPIKNLITAPVNVPVKEVMNAQVVSAPLNMDQEEVAQLVSKYNLLAIPVVDSLSKLVGVVTVDDVIDVIKEEATEDILKLAGTAEEELLNKSIFTIAKTRLPWLVATLFGGIVACHLMKSFQVTLEKVIALAFFIPVIMGMGGNIGIQSTALMVRGLATGSVDLAHIGRALLKEVKVGVVMGIICGLVVGLAAHFITGNYVLGIVVSAAMFCAITVAATIGILIPLLFKKVGIDPAVASGPFVTTTNDITGILIYFFLANWLFGILG